MVTELIAEGCVQQMCCGVVAPNVVPARRIDPQVDAVSDAEFTLLEGRAV